MTRIDIFDDITSEIVQKMLDTVEPLENGSEIEINIASYGGELLPVISVIDIMRAKHLKTTANVIGFAASAAAVLALSCDTVTISPMGSIMIHSAYCDGAPDDAGIARCNELQLEIIKKRCALVDKDTLSKDTWFTADECLSNGMADRLYESMPVIIDCGKVIAAHLWRNKMTVKADEQKLEEQAMEQPVVDEENNEKKDEDVKDEAPDVLEVIEKLSEELAALSARVSALEEHPEDENKDEEIQARLTKAYKRIATPSAKVAIGTGSCEKSVNHVDYKAFKSFIKG